MAIRISRYLKDTWLRKEDVDAMRDPDRKTHITKVYTKRIQGDERLIVAFSGIERHLPLNQENLRALVAAVDGIDDAGEFVGVQVELYVDSSVKFQGEEVGGIRLEAQRKQRPAAGK
jgi:hypothetical protein